MKHWHHHPGVRTGNQLSFGERAADLMRHHMGSWVFVFAFSAVMSAWILTSGLGHDLYPYILLNLVLSTLGALQGSIILIAQNRADQIAAEVAKHTLNNTETLRTDVATTKIDVRVLSEAIDHAIDLLEDRADGKAPSWRN
ncbi:DUF1003 domain-containing protein [Nocardia terpenica]|uniref:DUF1003 domain-containing protein n=1 Tax=Nocardia terpenica TaxID=455432 RepID=UPI00031C789E|nr:DUF1003 domain-containing protein [Nocardia terpenica]NQE89001.1 DUF1003 domain-containing protein [Nocardia terpenica]